VGLFALVVAVIAGLGGLAQINPVWLYGPFEPAAVSTAAQPDWYLGWTEGALRVFPAIRLNLFGFRIPELLWPGVVLPGLTFAALFAWPFVERRITGDDAVHHLLDRPRNVRWRTTLGVGALTFYVVLFLAGGQDIYAQKLGVSIEPVIWTFRVALFALPAAAAALAWKLCSDLAAADAIHA
jgi:ubiquinol-cytochrome c reductase cytochrome b subunit